MLAYLYVSLFISLSLSLSLSLCLSVSLSLPMCITFSLSLSGHSMPDSEAAYKSGFFALGSLVSSVFGSRVYQTISGKMQVTNITSCAVHCSYSPVYLFSIPFSILFLYFSPNPNPPFLPPRCLFL